MKLKITEADVLTLNNLRGKMLLAPDSHRLYTIMNFKTEEASETITKKRGFWKKTTTTTVEKQLYLISADVHTWYSTGKLLGTLSDDSAQWLLRRDLYYLRQKWVDFCDQLKAFGLEVTEIPTKQ